MKSQNCGSESLWFPHSYRSHSSSLSHPWSLAVVLPSVCSASLLEYSSLTQSKHLLLCETFCVPRSPWVPLLPLVTFHTLYRTPCSVSTRTQSSDPSLSTPPLSITLLPNLHLLPQLLGSRVNILKFPL